MGAQVDRPGLTLRAILLFWSEPVLLLADPETLSFLNHSSLDTLTGCTPGYDDILRLSMTGGGTKNMNVRGTVSRSVLLWLPLPLIGTGNGLLREFGYARFFSELTAHQLSAVIGIFLFGLYVGIILRKWRLPSSAQAIAMGVIWLVLTIAFELLFGHYIIGHPWHRLLHDYNLLEGRLWPLVLIWITLAPYVMTRMSSSVR